MRKIKTNLKKFNTRYIIYFLYTFFILTTLYHFYFAKKIIPGVYVGDINLGGLTFNQAEEVLANHIRLLPQSLNIKHNDMVFELIPADIQLTYTTDATVTRAFEVGRTGNILIDTKDKIAGLFKRLKISAYYEVDHDALSGFLSTIKGEINKLPEDAKYILNEDGTVGIVSEEQGYKVDDDHLYNVVVSSLDTLDYSDKPLKVVEAKPKIVSQNLENFKHTAEAYLKKDIVLKTEENTWDLDKELLLSFMQVRLSEDTVVLGLNTSSFEAYTDILASEVNQLPRGKVTDLRDNRVVEFEIIENGKELDVKQFTDKMKVALFDLQASGDVEIPFRVVSDSKANVSKYGIFSLLGEGKSKYTGSAEARIHNLSLAAERTNGILVPPGGVYSFNSAVGEISRNTGYTSAYVIASGRTVLGDGGGVCQTSTTLFRAVLDSGLPIVTRHPHDYRVYYYEIESPIGFDASIYQPSLDFQFKNDTPNYILLQSYVDKDNDELSFKIFGTPDDREIQITDPIVTNVSAPPAPLYQDDPSLPRGVVKQVDFAAGGATASFTRIVTKEGKEHFKDTYTTNYRPWRAIYLVGTKE